MSKMSTDDAFGPPPSSSSDKWFRMKDIDNYANKKARLRILELPAVTGMERWSAPTKDAPAGKPIRWRVNQPEPKGIEWKPEQKAKPFWAFWAYEYAAGKIKGWCFTQGSVITSIRALYDDDTWGAPTGYDITVSRKGSGLDTEYTVLPGSRDALPASVLQDWAGLKETATGLDALFHGGDPFAPFGSTGVQEDADIPF